MNPPLALYIHWPFCRKKCPYCDFNSHVRAEIDEKRWHDALLKELGTMASRLSGRELASIFFGGGTPSLMPPDTVRALIENAKNYWPSSEEPEITLEANPTSSEAAKFEKFREAGVNRLSMGIQSLRQKDLEFLGREHSVTEAKEAIGWARDIFPRYSFDLIYARPGQSVESWREELEEALEMAATHLSLYQLTIEEETPFARFYKAGDFELPDEETAAALYETTAEICARKNLFAYEVSNYAAPGAECRHNLTYWQGGEYAGIGPGAHGRIRENGSWKSTTSLKSPERWLSAVEDKNTGIEEETELSPRERFEECLMTGIRLREGTALGTIEKHTGYHADLEKPIAQLQQQGLLEPGSENLRLTPQGVLVVNYVIGKLLT